MSDEEKAGTQEGVQTRHPLKNKPTASHLGGQMYMINLDTSTSKKT